MAWLAALAIALVAAAVAHQDALWRNHGRLADAASHQLDLHAAGIESEFSKFEGLPSIVELDEVTFELLRHPEDPSLRERVSRRLLNLNVRAGSLAILLMDAQGRVLAASDWYEPGTALGSRLVAAPYFADAVANGHARSFVVDGSRGAPVSYFARALVQRDQVVGVVAVRASLESMQSAWAGYAAGTNSEKVLVIGDEGGVILSSHPPWRQRRVVATPTQAATADGAGALVLQRLRDLPFGARLIEVSIPGEAQAHRYVATEHPMARPGWRLLALSDASPASKDALRVALGAAALGALVGVLGLYLLLRRRARALEQASREALQRAKDELELRVAERTLELSNVNAALVNENTERRRTEAELRAAQDELVQAGRLALLGRMSAAITHEINQPLTALRALSDNTRRLLAAGRVQELERHMASIAGLTERIGRITAQLKSFARKSPAPAHPVRLRLAVANTLQLLRERIEAEGIDVRVEVDAALRVPCDGYRLEQVLVNLAGNAIDAMKGRPLRRLTIAARALDDHVQVRVADTGSGLPDAVRSRLFEPFFSTKPQGEGLGLGLVISSGILREFGGTLQAHSRQDGADFEFVLPLAPQPQAAEPA